MRKRMAADHEFALHTPITRFRFADRSDLFDPFTCSTTNGHQSTRMKTRRRPTKESPDRAGPLGPLRLPRRFAPSAATSGRAQPFRIVAFGPGRHSYSFVSVRGLTSARTIAFLALVV